MNAPDPFAPLLSLTRKPFPASTKVFVPGTLPGVAVPMREIALSNGERVTVYDTSGPYTDPSVAIDVRQGLAPVPLVDLVEVGAHVGFGQPLCVANADVLRPPVGVTDQAAVAFGLTGI